MGFASGPCFCIASALCMLSLIKTSAAQYTIEQCGGIKALEFELTNFEKYPVYFDENTTMTLAQTGVYKGPEELEEYVRFIDLSGPYMKTMKELNVTYADLIFDSDTGSCTYLSFRSFEYENEPSITAGYHYATTMMIKMKYSISKHKITQIDVFYTDKFILWFFEEALGSDKTRNYVCEVLESCEKLYKLNGSPTRIECVDKLRALPMTDGVKGYLDGNFQGCRILHATFAQENPAHCPHVSFLPAIDKKEKLKCQISDEIVIEDLFTIEDQAKMAAWCSEQESMNYSTDCFHVIDGPPSGVHSSENDDYPEKASDTASNLWVTAYTVVFLATIAAVIRMISLA